MQLKPLHLFLLVIAFYAAMMVLLKPYAALGGEMWAEMATNYYANAIGQSYFYKFFALDAGYIPATPRLIALIGYYLDIPVPYIPYFYTWTAILLSAVLVGSFCLTPFRKLIPNDTVRFMTSLIVLWVVDSDTRNFVNFSYFGCFFIAITTALAWSDRENNVPKWAWFVPILIISKPGVLAVLPAMLITACFSRPRFRWITFVCAILCAAQIIQILNSANYGLNANIHAHDSTSFTKLIVSFQYFFGLLSSYLLNLNYPSLHLSIPILLGILIFIGCLYSCVKNRNGEAALILVGLSLLYFNVFMNCFAVSAVWNEDLHHMKSAVIYRHIIVGFQGVMLVAVGLLSMQVDWLSLQKKRLSTTQLAVIIFISYFLAAGLIQRGYRLNKEMHSPAIYNSYWQALASDIDQKPANLCVPIDPAGRVYPEKCAIGNTLSSPKGEQYSYLATTQFKPAADIQKKTITGFAILIKTVENKKTRLKAQGTLHLKNGQTVVLTQEKTVHEDGGLLLFRGTKRVPVNQITKVTLTFSEPTEVACYSIENPAILWLP